MGGLASGLVSNRIGTWYTTLHMHMRKPAAVLQCGGLY